MSRGQPGKGQDRRQDRQGQGQGCRGRRAQGGRPAGVYQGDRALRRRRSPSAMPTRATTCRRSPATSRRPIPRPSSWWNAPTSLRIFLDIPERYAALRAEGHEGRRARRRAQRPGDPRHRHADLLGHPREDPHLVDGNRPDEEGVRRPAAGNVRLRQRVRPAARRLRPAAAGAGGVGQPDLLLTSAEDGKAVKTPVACGRQRRQMGRGRQA